MIFIKGARYFEAKKAINYELEAHSHSGDEERKMEIKRNWGDGRSLKEKKGRKCWLLG